MSTINYSLTPIDTAFTGTEDILYRANVQTNGTVTMDDLATDIAARTGQDKELIQYVVKALNTAARTRLRNGYRVNFGEIAMGFSIRGTFNSADEAFNPLKHSLVPTVHTTEPLTSALADITPENAVGHLTCTVGSLMDSVTHDLNVITGTNVVHIQGWGLGIDTTHTDEGVFLLDSEGAIKATATVSASTIQTIDCNFATPPEVGIYTLLVKVRNGERTSLAPASAKLNNIIVKAAS